MKKKALSLIIGLMSLSMLGLIGLQAYWLRHAMAVKEEQFDRSVNDALNQVVHQLEVRELANGLQKHLASARQQQETIALVNMAAQSPIQKPVEQVKTVSNTSQTFKGVAQKTAPDPEKKDQSRVKVEKAEVNPNTIFEETKRVLSYDRHPEAARQERIWKLRQDGPGRVFITHADSVRKRAIDRQFLYHSSIDSIPAVIRLNPDSVFKLLNAGKLSQVKEVNILPLYDSVVFRKFMPVKQRFEFRTDTLVIKKNKPEKARILKPAQPVVVKKEVLQRKQEQVNEVMEKMVMELVTKEVPLRNRLNFNEVDSLVANALADKNITLPYAVAIAGNQPDSLLHVKQVNTTYMAGRPNYKVSLFPNDLIKKREYLLLQFPDKQQYVLGSMWTMLSASAVFTIIMLVTFGATLGFIFRQKKISEIKSDFINNMTHEFKTPIATISLATDAINSPKVLADQSRIGYYTGIIKQENKRMLSQVENVLQMALLDKQNLKLNFGKVALDDIINQATEELKLQIESRNGELSFNSGTSNVYVYADQLHLENVFLNLLDNANKYSPEAPVIAIRSEVINNKVCVTISDQGIGMSPDTQKRIFDKFYRVPTGNLHNVKGFGLGLAYVKAITEQHKGHISVKSTIGKGSQFQVCLPVYNAS